MIDSLIHFIEQVLIPLGGWGVFLACLLEEIIAPIPSAFVLTLSGFIFLDGPLSFDLFLRLIFIVVLPASLGVTIGSLAVYGIAYGAGKPILIRWGRWLGLSWRDVETLQKKLDTKNVDEITLFVLRVIPLVPSVAISACYGLIRFDIKKYLLLTFLGTCIRATMLALLGWKVGSLYLKYAHVIGRVEGVIFLVIGFIVLCVVIYYVKRSQNRK